MAGNPEEIDKIRHYKEELNFVIDILDLAVWTYDPATNTFSGDDRFRNWLGLPADEKAGLQLVLNRVVQADRQRFQEAITRALAPSSGGACRIEYGIVNDANGFARSVVAIGKTSFRGNVPYRLSGVLQDITKEKQNAEKMRKREDHTQIAVDASLIGTFDVDYVTDKTIISKRTLRIFGLPDETGHSGLIQSIHPEDRPVRQKAYEAAMKTGNLLYEARIIWPDTSIHWISVEAKLQLTEKGKPGRITGTVKDITEQKNMLRSLQESEKRFREVVRQAPIGITIFRGPDFLVEMANETYLQLVGRKEADFVGRPLFEVLPEVKESVEGLLAGVYKTGLPYHGLEFPVTLNRYGKEEVTYFNFVYHPLKNESGEVDGIIVVAMDVSDTVKAKKALTESERQFRNLVMQSPIPMAIFRGKDYVVELANNVMFEKMWRKKPADVQGKKILDVFPELKGQKYPELLHRVFTTGKSHHETESVAYVQGDDELKKFYLDYEYAPLFEADNVVSGIMVTVNDVTEKVEARKRIEDIEERARLAVNAGELGVYEIDLKTDSLQADKRFFEIFGFDREVSWNHLKQALHEEDVARRNSAFNTALQTGLLEYEARFVKPDNTISWIKIKGRIIFDNGEPAKLLGIVMDITKQKEFEEALENKVKERTQELAEANAQLHQSNVELNQFAYIASHDLQEPLRKVRTFTELMYADLGEVSDKTRTYINKIQRSTERMQNLINDILKFSLLSKEREKFEQVDLNVILNNVLNDYELLIEQKHAKIRATELPVIEAIPLQMSQLITNLISNALKFSKKDTPLEISVSARKLDNKSGELNELSENETYYQVELKDNGIGFEQENAEKIFTIFQRLHGRTEFEGTGIGLAMCKKIVQNHHGAIQAKSVLNEGSTFVITLPKTQSRPPGAG